MQFIENKIHPKVRLNSICPYFTMFPLSFPYSVLLNASKNEVVYDPFCGRGTTNFAARLLGLRSYGVDSNPVAFAVAQSKIINIKAKSIVTLCDHILKQCASNNIPQGEFWQMAFHPVTLIDICSIRDYLIRQPQLSKSEIALRSIMLGLLHGPTMKTQSSYFSNQMPRTFSTKPDYSIRYWKSNNLNPQYVGVLELVRRRANYIFNDETPSETPGNIVQGDSRFVKKVSNFKFDWILTSPPYFGMTTYEQDQWLRNWFLGGLEKVDYVRKAQIGHWSEKTFVGDLAQVWRNSAGKANCGANLVIRFGALPSKSESTPEQLIRRSLDEANCGWKIEKVINAGQPRQANRQANQFHNSMGTYIEEIDVFAKLN